MKNETIHVIVTYLGDIRNALLKTGSQCPYRLDKDGNTEQSIELFRGGAASHMSVEDLVGLSSMIILEDCNKNGQVISWKAVIEER